jgi:transposase
MTKQVYLEILGDEMGRSVEHLGFDPGEVIFQQDNASSHKAKVCMQWFEDHGIELLEWPPSSPDLNPIGNLWAELKRHLGTYKYPLGGMLELWEHVQTEWDGIEPEYCHRLIESMPDRMAQVLHRKGGAIDY